MSLIQKITPVNLLEEKEKFFADESYNPQFEYEEKFDEEILYKHGYPQVGYLDLAQEILDRAYSQRTETDLRQLRGSMVDQKTVEKKIIGFLDMHLLRERFKLIWSNSFVARVTITNSTIKLRLPAKFREQDLIGMLYHEIGTHALRRVNYEQQPWFKKKKKYGFRNYLETEEGLATLHAFLPQKFQLAYFPALNYTAVKYAQNHSFAELWKFVTPYIDDPERRFIFVFRKKRGLADTSQPGGFTKDLTYFSGMINVWRYLKQNDFNPTKLYLGKLALENVDKAVKMNPDFKPLLPSFLVVNHDEYAQKIYQIGITNLLK